MPFIVLVINPGSTSTKFAVFSGDTCIFDQSLSHSVADLAGFPTVASQYEFRERAIRHALEERHFDLKNPERGGGAGRASASDPRRATASPRR